MQGRHVGTLQSPHQERKAPRLPTLPLRHRIQTPLRVPHQKPRRKQALQMRGVLLRVREQVHVELPHEVAFQRLPVPLQGLQLRSQILPQFKATLAQIQPQTRSRFEPGRHAEPLPGHRRVRHQTRAQSQEDHGTQKRRTGAQPASATADAFDEPAHDEPDPAGQLPVAAADTTDAAVLPPIIGRFVAANDAAELGAVGPGEEPVQLHGRARTRRHDGGSQNGGTTTTTRGAATAGRRLGDGRVRSVGPEQNQVGHEPPQGAGLQAVAAQERHVGRRRRTADNDVQQRGGGAESRGRAREAGEGEREGEHGVPVLRHRLPRSVALFVAHEVPLGSGSVHL